MLYVAKINWNSTWKSSLSSCFHNFISAPDLLSAQAAFTGCFACTQRGRFCPEKLSIRASDVGFDNAGSSKRWPILYSINCNSWLKKFTGYSLTENEVLDCTNTFLEREFAFCRKLPFCGKPENFFFLVGKSSLQETIF